jgi:hypothetical protein
MNHKEHKEHKELKGGIGIMVVREFPSLSVISKVTHRVS